MHYHIIADFWGQKDKLVIKVEIPVLRTASPAAFLIPDGDPSVHDSMPIAVMRQKMIHSVNDECSRLLLVRII